MNFAAFVNCVVAIVLVVVQFSRVHGAEMGYGASAMMGRVSPWGYGYSAGQEEAKSFGRIRSIQFEGTSAYSQQQIQVVLDTEKGTITCQETETTTVKRLLAFLHVAKLACTLNWEVAFQNSRACYLKTVRPS